MQKNIKKYFEILIYYNMFANVSMFKHTKL